MSIAKGEATLVGDPSWVETLVVCEFVVLELLLRVDLRSSLIGQEVGRASFLAELVLSLVLALPVIVLEVRLLPAFTRLLVFVDMMQ